MTAALNGLVNKFDLKGQTLGDVALGAVVKHSRDFNLARESVIESGLSIRTPAVDLQRACGTSIEAAVMIANKIALGQIESGIAGGTDTVSDAPIVYNDDYRRMLLDMHAAHGRKHGNHSQGVGRTKRASGSTGPRESHESCGSLRRRFL
jgi:acetyl-CoA C-acetyltransferase